jgi:signal transduction histidine kinase
LKEGLSNGLRHGNATAFYFELKIEDKKIKFLLSDNGDGIEINQMKEGMGLSGMVEHAERLGGKIQFLSDKDEGFEIQLTLPMDVNKTEKP